MQTKSETADTSALPPPGKDREPVYIEYDDAGNEHQVPNDLRLYCMRISDTVVFLFDGDIKTAAKAQDCENVKPYFRQANQLTTLIDQALKDKEIKWNSNFTDIVVEDGFRLMW